MKRKRTNQFENRLISNLNCTNHQQSQKLHKTPVIEVECPQAKPSARSNEFPAPPRMPAKLIFLLSICFLSKIAHCQSGSGNIFFINPSNQPSVSAKPAGIGGGSPQNNVVFPSQSSAVHDQGRRLALPAAAIYVNPNPSTRSTGALAIINPQQQRASAQAAQRWRPTSSIGSNPSSIGKSEQNQVADWPFFKSLQVARSAQMFNQLAPPRPSQEQQQPAQRMPPTSAPDNSVRLIDKSQSIESMRVAKNEALENETEGAAEPSDGDQGAGESTSGSTPSIQMETSSETPSLGRLSQGLNLDNSATLTSGATMSTTTSSTSTTTTTTSTTTTSTTTSTTTTTPAPPTARTVERDDRLVRTDEGRRAAVPPLESRVEKEMFSSKFHSSVQQAVNRLVEMGAKALEKESTATGGQVNTAKVSIEQPKVNSSSSGTVRGPNLHSSLSLNVLLKNFGVSNLTSLDQILLKSSLNSNDHVTRTKSELDRAREALPFGHQAIRINGGHELIDDHDHHQRADMNSESGGLGATSTPQQSNDKSPTSSAECKIQYTLKNVNISLINGEKSDYTCDYIIDRKMALNGHNQDQAADSKRIKLDERRACKLHLRSRFFSNQSETISGEKDADSICSGQTHLAIGEINFCLASQMHRPDRSTTLNRAFEFPINRESFDVRLVHKRPQQDRPGERDDSLLKQDEIYLEIRPLMDAQCRESMKAPGTSHGRADSDLEPSAEANSEDSPSSKPDTSTRGPDFINSTMATSTSEEPARNEYSEPDSNSAPSTQPPESYGAEQQLGARALNLPLNTNRLSPKNKQTAEPDRGTRLAASPKITKKNKLSADEDRRLVSSTSQQFDVNNAVTGSMRYKVTHPESTTSGDNTSEQHYESQLPACANQTQVHVSTVGQLMTPNYPNEYPPNLRCRMIIRRVSLAYCKLLLHYRDFDLVNSSKDFSTSPKVKSHEDCSGDYLQIGETRYCNKYAMIGHKMLLDFADAGSATTSRANIGPIANLARGESDSLGASLESVELVFNSDSSQNGRGFLIKYQQILCQQPKANSPGTIEASKPKQKLTDQGTSSSAEQEALRSKTLAPPMQQPDFGLALRTSPSPGVDGPVESTVNRSDQGQASSSSDAKKKIPNSKHSTREEPSVVIQKSKLSKSHLSRDHNTATTGSSLQLQMASTASSGLLVDPLDTSSDLSNNHQPHARVNHMEERQQQQQHRRSSNQLQPQVVQSVLSSLDESSRGKNFQQDIACNHVNHEMSFLLQSQNYPKNYANNLRCTYHVRRNSSRVCYLELTFIKFDLEADADCRFDYLEINNVRLCGSLKDFGPHKTTRIYLFEEPMKMLHFKSDAIGTKSGFLIRADQLECAPNGSIVRSSSLPDLGSTRNLDKSAGRASPVGALNNERRPQSISSTTERGNGSTSNYGAGLQANVFEYDSSLVRASTGISDLSGRPAHQAGRPKNPTDIGRLPLAGNPVLPVFSASCDQLLYGSEMTIKSPLWPESYANDESIKRCKYTVLRHTPARHSNSKAICQLELRFVHLRLGPADCLEIDSHELLCGFTAKNLVKYYPLVERQTHSTITFIRGPPININASASTRFMIIVRQLECVDGFLAPQVELVGTLAPVPSPPPPVNASSLQYIGISDSGDLGQIKSTRYLSNGITNFTDETQVLRQAQQQQQKMRSNENRPRMNYDAQPNATRSSAEGVLMYSFANTLAPFDNDRTYRQRLQPGSDEQQHQQCSIQHTQFNGILTSANLLARMESIPGRNLGDVCEVRVKMLPGFCQLQLSFGEFDLHPGRTLNGFCSGEFVELAGMQYCGDELKNSTRTLDSSSAGQRHVSVRVSISSSHSFRAIFKQLECQPRPIGELIPTIRNDPMGSGAKLQAKLQDSTSSASSQNGTRPTSTGTSDLQSSHRIDFREIPVRGEHFELDSSKLLPPDGSGPSRQSYAPNMFIVYRLKRSQASVCKVRLLFYKFDLEPPLEGGGGCKHDFLDINNNDRLCGQIEDGSLAMAGLMREYSWPRDEGDFQISFVSDSQIQRSGFYIFGQQIVCARQTQTEDEPKRAKEREQSGKPGSVGVTGGGATKEQSMVVFDEQHPTTAPHTSSPATGDRAESATVAPPSAMEGNDEHRHKRIRTLDGANCSSIVDSEMFRLSSPNWPQRYNSLGHCRYLIQRAHSNVCSVTMHVSSLILDINGPDQEESAGSRQCDKRKEDYLEVDRGNGDTLDLCGWTSRPLSFTFELGPRRPFLVAKFISNSNSGFGFLIEGKQNTNCTSSADGRDPAVSEAQKSGPPSGQNEGPSSSSHHENDQRPPQTAESCNRLLTEDFNMIESDNFPNSYAHNQDCLIAVRRSNESVCAVDLVLSHFDLEGESPLSGSCENDYIEVDYGRFCGSSYPTNHRLRFNYFDSQRDKLIKFHSDAANSRTGFSIQVIQVKNCEFSGDERSSKPPSPDVETAAPLANLGQSIPNGQDKEVINYLPSNTRDAHGQVSVVGLQPQAPANSTSNTTSVHLEASERPTLCRFVYHNERQLLVSPNYNQHKMSYDNNLDCQYKIVAKGYEFCSLRITLLDLDLVDSGRMDADIGADFSASCPNDYLLIDSRRYCGRISSAPDRGSSPQVKASAASSSNERAGGNVIELGFDANLPREIDILYHTDGHANQGRGFKLLAEQVACDEPASQAGSQSKGSSLEARLSTADDERAAQKEARQTHRSHFGSLNYPKNYVSSQVSASRMRPLSRFQSGRTARISGEHQEDQTMSSEPSASRLQSQDETTSNEHLAETMTIRKGIVVSRTAELVAAEVEPEHRPRPFTQM